MGRAGVAEKKLPVAGFEPKATGRVASEQIPGTQGVSRL